MRSAVDAANHMNIARFNGISGKRDRTWTPHDSLRVDVSDGFASRSSVAVDTADRKNSLTVEKTVASTSGAAIKSFGRSEQ